MRPDSGRTLINRHHELAFHTFLGNQDTTLVLPVVSASPFRAVSLREKIFKKIDCSPQQDPHHLYLIEEDAGIPHSFVWHTTGHKLKTGIRWGIIQPASLTGQVIASLGHYRITVHERIVKGMATATQAYKLSLLDHFQDRLALLSNLESLVNHPNTMQAICDTFKVYRGQLITLVLPHSVNAILPGVSERCKEDINSAIRRAQYYLDALHLLGHDPVTPANCARGEYAILEFVKNEAIQTLYELQGLNQGITYSSRRPFALTRGDLNDNIEDARKVIDDHRADPRNAVTALHHCHYPDDMQLAYHFEPTTLHPENERQALLAISFIENWDRVTYPNPDRFNPTPDITVTTTNNRITQYLTIIRATKWRSHRSLLATFKSVGYFFWNALKNFLLPVHPWPAEAWSNPYFHLHYHNLHVRSRPNYPLWIKVRHFIKEIYFVFLDMFKGIRDFAYNLVIELPSILVNDWASIQFKEDIDTLYLKADNAIQRLNAEETKRLSALLTRWEQSRKRRQTPSDQMSSASSPIVYLPVTFPYPLSAGEQNDILTSVVRGVDGFMSLFTHSIYSKDPISGVLFTFAYMSGGAALLLPNVGKKIFGEAYVSWFTEAAKILAATPIAGTIAAGSSQAQLIAWTWDMLMHGPKSGLVKSVKEVLKDPLTLSICFGLAYSVGYVLANGINGVDIPGLSAYLREEAGSAPGASYPITGAKVLIALYEILHTPAHPMLPACQASWDDTLHTTDPTEKRTLKKIKLSVWLARHAADLPKLGRRIKFLIEQHIDYLYESDEAASLKQFIYPVKPSSIAYQLFYIPLSYIPLTLRLFIAVGMSCVACLKNSRHPWRPMQRAGQCLASALAYDLTRLLIFTHELFRMVSKGLGVIFKAFAYTANILISRMASLFHFSPDHAIHRGFAAIHRTSAHMREWLYPARLTRHVVVTHPICTVQAIQSSYAVLMKKYGKRRPTHSNSVPNQPTHVTKRRPAVMVSDQHTAASSLRTE